VISCLRGHLCDVGADRMDGKEIACRLCSWWLLRYRCPSSQYGFVTSRNPDAYIIAIWVLLSGLARRCDISWRDQRGDKRAFTRYLVARSARERASAVAPAPCIYQPPRYARTAGRIAIARDDRDSVGGGIPSLWDWLLSSEIP